MERRPFRSSEQYCPQDDQNGSPYYIQNNSARPASQQTYPPQYPSYHQPFYPPLPPHTNYPMPGFGSWFNYGQIVHQTFNICAGDPHSPLQHGLDMNLQPVSHQPPSSIHPAPLLQHPARQEQAASSSSYTSANKSYDYGQSSIYT